MGAWLPNYKSFRSLTQTRIFVSIKGCMKRIARGVVINSFSLFLLAQIFSGVKISGGIQTFIFGGFFLSLMGVFLRPLLNLLTLPFNVLTLGLASVFVNVIILYLLTIIVSEIVITPFVFPGFGFAGIIIPKISLNLLFAYLASSLALSVIVSAIQWIIKE